MRKSYSKIIIAFVLLCAVFIYPAHILAYAHIDNDTDAEAEAKRKGLIAVPIAMYHSTSNKKPCKYNLTPEQFERDLLFIKEKGYTTITVADLLEYKKGIPLPEKIIMLTFDDGYMNNYTNIFPLLKKHNMKIVMSVVGALTDSNYNADGSLNLKYSHLSYEQIKEMHDSGLVEIQNHTYNMHGTKGRKGLKRKFGESREDYERILTQDLTALQRRLSERTGITPTAVAFPFGYYTKPDTFEILKKIGFKAAFSCTEGINYINRTSDLFCLKRYNRPHGKSSEAFFKKLKVK